MLAARESEVAVLRSQLDSQLLSLDSHIRSKEADVIRKHEELMQVRDSLNHKISTQRGDLERLQNEANNQKQLLNEITRVLETKQEDYKMMQLKLSDLKN